MKTLPMRWHIHTPNMLREIVQCSGMDIYRIPMCVLSRLLHQVAVRASELDDPRMNALMCDLTLYAAADPESPDYDPRQVKAVMKAAGRSS